MIGRWMTVFALAVAMICSAGCSRGGGGESDGRLRVVVTTFPLYDFVRVVGGEHVAVQMLLPPGVEAHSYEPRPDDVVRVSRADLFVFTSPEMEPWADRLFRGVQGGKGPLRVEAGKGARYLENAGDGGHDGHGHDRHGGSRDPHIWLNPANAALMVDTIAAALAERLPTQRDRILSSAAAYRVRLADLDSRFKAGLADCATREFIHGGHYAFAYLADRYNLTYRSAYGITADSEPTPRQMVELVTAIRSHGVKAIFSEELLSPRVAETLAAESGVELLKLHGIHNITRQEMDTGATYLGLMEQNLAQLRKGLSCR